MSDYPNFKDALASIKKEPKTFDEGVEIITEALKRLVLSKHKKYGKKNIQDLGQIGIFCRAYDKTARLREHFVNKVELGQEGTLDSFADLAGYGIVDIMYEMGWYDLSLKKTLKKTEKKTRFSESAY